MKQHSDIKNEIARQSETTRATSDEKVQYKKINISNDATHLITHPACYSCGSLMILLNDGKLCPSCGRFAPASEEWIKAHPKYSGLV